MRRGRFYKQGFLKRTAADRDVQLQALDSYCADKMDTPSRETADLLTRKRELLDLHHMLRNLGR